MNNFLKAHAIKKRRTGRQGADNKMKLKLKRMLSGYKRNDTNAILGAVDISADESEIDLTIDTHSDLEKSWQENSSSEGSANEYAISENESPGHELNKNSIKSRIRKKYSSSLSASESDSNEEFANKSCNGKSFVQDSVLESSEQESTVEEPNRKSSSGSDDTDSFTEDKYLSTNVKEKSLDFSANLEFSSGCEEENQLTNVSMNSAITFDTSTSSSHSEFDEEGLLAEAILYKLDKPTEAHTDVAPSTSGYIQINKKKSLRSNKFKNDKKPYAFTLNASNQKLPEFSKLFNKYTFSPTKITNNPQFCNKLTNFNRSKLNNVKINKCFTDHSESEEEEKPEPINGFTDEKAIRANKDEIVKYTLTYDDDDVALEPPSAIRVEFHHVKNGFIVCLSHPCKLYFHGKVRITSLCGCVDIMGHKLMNATTNAYAPRFSFAQTITTVPQEVSHFGLFSKLTALGMPVLTTEDIVVSTKEYDSVLHLEKLGDVSLDFIQTQYPGVDLFQMPKRVACEQFPEVVKKLSCSFYTENPYKAFEEVAIWPQIVKYETGSKGIVCGGKGTGKSTFLKYYINSVVTEGPVLVVDLDPGQAEFTVAGSVSVTVVAEPVIGPNFTHLLQTKLMLNLGVVNILENVERYISAVTKLLQYAEQEEYRNMPCIVNTMGMSNSLGLKILSYIILLLKPTFLVQMDSDVQNKCFQMLLTANEIKRKYNNEYESDGMFDDIKCSEDFSYKFFHSTQIKQPKGENLTPKDKRYLSFLSYFGKALSKSNTNLLSVRPYVVQINSIKIATTCKVDEDAITSVINGKIVALCENSSEINEKTFNIADNALVCLGYGLVRGIDLNTESMYIITSEGHDVISRVNVLLYSECHPDLKLNDDGLALGTFIPYRAPLRPHNKQLLTTPKRRFNPLQLIKIKRNNLSKQ